MLGCRVLVLKSIVNGDCRMHPIRRCRIKCDITWEIECRKNMQVRSEDVMSIDVIKLHAGEIFDDGKALQTRKIFLIVICLQTHCIKRYCESGEMNEGVVSVNERRWCDKSRTGGVSLQ